MRRSKASEAFLSLSLRERGLILFALIASITFASLQLVVVPLIEQQRTFNEQNAQQRERIAELTVEREELKRRIANNPNNRLKADKLVLEGQLEELRQKLSEKVATLLSPKQTQTLLSSLLQDYHGLSLVEARNLPPSIVEVKTEQYDETKDGSKAVITVYEHGFEMVFTGTYFQTRDFLKRLEGLEGFYWDSFRYEVTKYPEAKIMLGITTLSIDEAWIGG